MRGNAFKGVGVRNAFKGVEGNIQEKSLTRGTQLRQQVGLHVLVVAVHAVAQLHVVGEHRLLGAFTRHLRQRWGFQGIMRGFQHRKLLEGRQKCVLGCVRVFW